MSRIVDNGDITLSSALNEVLPFSNALDACVGYFNLRGWNLLREGIGRMDQSSDSTRPPVRLLVGMAVPPERELRQALEEEIEATARSTASKRADEAVLDFARQLVWGIPTKFDEHSLRQLRRDLEEGLLKVKFAAREPLHAKLYVSHLSGVGGYRAVVGSSNFTVAGLRRQGELSLEESDQQVAEELSQWFDKRWEDTFSIDITDELIDVLKNSWVREIQPTPYHVYLRLAYELSRDARDGLTLEIPPEVRQVLLPHQESAVRVATRILDRKGIAVIGDVVGLGKTLTGTAIAATAGESVLVIAPKNLTKMWQEHLERFHIPGRVLSLSMATKELPDLRRFRLVLVDESHNLRTRNRKTWNAIHEYIDSNDCKVVLLTATMFNANHKDIGGQLGLKLQHDEPLGVRPERLIQQIGAVELARKTGGRLDSLAAFECSEFNDDWQRLLSEYLVRRTRNFLESTYGKTEEASGLTTLQYPDGSTFRFPVRIPEPIRYPGGELDPNDRLATDSTFEAVDSLTYARYRLGLYLIDGANPASSEEEELLEDLQTSITSAAGFMRTTALKRLSSSAYAFIITIKKMITRNAILEYAITNGLPIPLGTISDAFLDPDAMDDEEIDEVEKATITGAWGIGWTTEQWLKHAENSYQNLAEKGSTNIRWARPGLFKKTELVEDVRADSEILQDLLDSRGVWDAKDDTKLRSLAELINSLPQGEKVLVFSEYKDTVDYLAEHLPVLTERQYASASGGSSDPVRLARRFAPIANAQLGGLPPGETEIDVLLTTDVLSEGQNLQDAAIVVNWDLPWTIIKIIQRAGRVDRVGQESESIRVLSFLPDEGVEGVIRLRERLLGRLQNSTQIFGGNERFFHDDDFSTEVAGLFDGSAQLVEDEGEVDSASYALEIWEASTERDRNIALGLQEVVYSTKFIASSEEEKVVTYGRTEAGTDLLVLSTTSNTVFLTPVEALQHAESEITEKCAPALETHLDHVREASKAMTEQVKENTLILNHGLSRRLYEFLTRQSERLDLPTLTSARTNELIDAITNNPLREGIKGEVNQILRSIKTLGDEDGPLQRLISLHEDHLIVDERGIGTDRVQIVTSIGFNPNMDGPPRKKSR